MAFILHDVFRYSFAEVGEIVGRTPAACRQLASSARHRISAARTPATAASARVVREFKRAWEAQDIAALVGLLDPGATAVADSGGLVPAAIEPVHGGELIAGLVIDLARRSELTILERTVNGQPGLVFQENGATVTVMAFAVDGERIQHIWAVRNPEKLRTWTT